MANFEISQKIRTEKPISKEEVKTFIKERLKKSCYFKVASESDASMDIKGSVKEVFFTPVANFKAVFSIKAEGDKARLEINGSSYPNWILWIMVILGFFTFGSFILVGIILFLIQMNKPRKALEDILKAFDSEFGVL